MKKRTRDVVPAFSKLVALVCLIALTALFDAPSRAQTTAISLVQHGAKDAGVTTSSSLTFPANNTAGNLIVVAARSGKSSEVFSVSDSVGNTYRQAAQIDVSVDAPAGDTLAIFYAEGIKSGFNTVTVADSISGATLRFAILEYSGLASANSLEAGAAAQGTSASPNSGSVATTANGDLLIGAIMSGEERTFFPGSGYTIRDQIPAPPNTKLMLADEIQVSAGSASATASISASANWGAAVAAFRRAANAPPPAADMTLSKTHGGTFTQGQVGASYTLIVTNSGGGSSNGAVTVTDAVPNGLTPTALNGTGWTCDLPSRTCSRSDSLAAGASYSPITLTVNVAGNAPSSVTNTATVSGGGESNTSNDSASDVTSINGTSDTTPPSAPGSLTATEAGGSQINLSWVASTDNVGVAHYHIEQCLSSRCSNFTEIATVGSNPISGPLSASPNPSYFRDASGKPIILSGSHTWNSLQDWGTNGTPQSFDFNAFVQDLSAHGHNFTLLWRTELATFCGLPSTASSPPDFTVDLHPWQRTGPGTATDGKPRFDLSKLSQPYFDRLRTRVQALNNAGIYVGVFLFTGEWLNVYRCATDGYPFSGPNNINGIDDSGGSNSITMTAPNAITAIQDAYVQKLVDTLNDLPNILWKVSGEAPPESAWWIAHQTSHIRSYESTKAFQHPIGHGVNADFQDSTIINSDADWISPVARISPTTTCGSGTPRCKVNINDSDHSYFGMWNNSAQLNRNYAWQNFTNGNQVLFMDPYDVSYSREARNNCASPVNGICSSPDPRWNNFRDNLGYILAYSRELNLANVTPQSSLCSTSHCLAQTPTVGAEYLIYAPYGGTFTVNLSAMSSSRTLKVEWFNPATGATTTAAAVAAGSSSQSFTPPFAGDAVLYLVDSAGHAASMPTLVSYSVTGLAPGAYSYRVRASDAAGNLGAYSNVASATMAQGPPDLTVAKTHSGTFTQGQTGATYTLTVSNIGATSTGGMVTLTDSLPVGLSATALSGTGWNCTLSSLTCTRGDALPAGTSYPVITLTVTVASNAPSTVTNTASVSGGGESNTSNDSAADSTSIVSGSGAISLVQHIGKDAGFTTSSSLTFPSPNTTGNWIGVVIRAGNTGQRFTVTDTRGDTFRQAIQYNETVDGTTIGVFYAENIAGGTNTITVTDTSAGWTLRFAILEFAGVASAGSFEGATATQGTSATPSSGALTTTSNGDLILGLISTGNPATFTAGSGFVIEERVSAAPNTKLIAADLRQASAGPVSATATLGATDQWGAAVAAFRAAGGASPGTDMTLSKTHTGLFTAGQTGAYTLTVSVANSAPATVINAASMSGGGETNSASNSASDVTQTSATLSVSPRTAVLTFDQQQQFSAGGVNVTWSVDSVQGGSLASGTISSSGLYTPPNSVGAHTVTATSQSQSANATVYVTNYPGTFTRGIDNQRTGLNSKETVLSRANVNATQFGKLFSYPLDGVSDASPLYVANVDIPGKGLRNVVYVATEHDSVFAFDADGLQSSPLWQVNFIGPAQGITTVPRGDISECCDISPEIGITGSPVIDPATNTLYVVAKTKEISGANATYVHRLHALDITTGSEKLGGPVVISGSVSGTGDGSSGGSVPFLSLRENQRPALLLSNGVVYVAFAAHGDQPPYHGWVFGYNASNLQQVMVYNTTPDGAAGGVWQSGDGLSTDSSGNIFFVTGNGGFTADVGGRDYGDSFVKLSATGAVLDYFTPHDQANVNAGDLDLGSGGATLLPDQSGPHPHLAVSAGKNGTIYVVDRDNMGHYRTSNDNQIVQVLPKSLPGGTFATGNFKAPVYWNGRLYFSADGDFIRMFTVTNGLLSTSPASMSSFVVNYTGAALSVSANGNSNSILWAVERVDQDPLGNGTRAPGVLHGFDATDLSTELYNSNEAAGARDSLDFAAKWAAPLVANGKVFVASEGLLTVFGLLP